MLTSIKAKIVIFHLVVLFAALSVLGGLLYFSLTRIVYREVDADLSLQAQALTALTDGDREDRAEFLSSTEYAWEYASPKSKSFYQIRRLNGAILEKSPTLKEGELPKAVTTDRPAFRTIMLKGSPIRLVDFPVPAGHGAGQSFVIQCAEDIRSQLGILRRYELVLFTSLAFIMAASALGGIVISRKALAPVKDISETIDAISESNLSERINVGYVPKELRILASSFNRTVDRLEEAFHRQNQFAADASHELRTPLSVVLSQSEIALRKERTAEEYRNALAAILETARKMSATVGKLLTLTRLRADKGQLSRERIEVGAIIEEAARLLRPLAEHRNIRLNMPQTAGQTTVSGDRAALLELFINLLDNAIKYNVPGGEVYISLRKEKGSLLCEIRDTGIGIPEEDLGNVLDRFYRVDRARSQEIEGSGLGLSICREIVDLHGGRIEIASRKGEGTGVTVRLNNEDV